MLKLFKTLLKHSSQNFLIKLPKSEFLNFQNSQFTLANRYPSLPANMRAWRPRYITAQIYIGFPFFTHCSPSEHQHVTSVFCTLDIFRLEWSITCISTFLSKKRVWASAFLTKRVCVGVIRWVYNAHINFNERLHTVRTHTLNVSQA